jgi:ElaB/YqjD/DUF883 family membrane-anchored ribosome-binding protein
MTEGFESTPDNGGATDQAKEKAQEAAGQAKDKAQEAAGQAKNRLASEVDTRSTQAGEQLRSSADDVRGVAEHLRGQGKDKPAELAEKTAERVQQLGDYLHRADGDGLLRDVEDFARRKPWAVAAGGLALGFAASRFLKASSARRYEASHRTNGARAADAPPWTADAGNHRLDDRSAVVPPAPARTGVT